MPGHSRGSSTSVTPAPAAASHPNKRCAQGPDHTARCQTPSSRRSVLLPESLKDPGMSRPVKSITARPTPPGSRPRQ